jgi:dTDP-glucose 4,6-dehydratase
MKKIIITGGAGFIGSNLAKKLIGNNKILIIDKLTTRSNILNIGSILKNKNFFFKKIDICNFEQIKKVFYKFKPNYIFNLAAESHVDKSIDNADQFIKTNILGVYNLLKISHDYYNQYYNKKLKFIFHHISTDEVFGDLPRNSKFKFDENYNYKPNSPYSASKASSDHLVRAWNKTFHLPTIISNCSNNFGEYQHPEKLIPHTILSFIKGKDVPVYGKGRNIRDWIYVQDHCDALIKIMNKGKIGNTYNIGANCEIRNIDIVKQICKTLEKKLKNTKLKKLIKFVEDRPGHDFRYAVDSSKINNELKWISKYKFKDSLDHTINWYIKNKFWWQQIINKGYKLKRIGKNNEKKI